MVINDARVRDYVTQHRIFGPSVLREIWENKGFLTEMQEIYLADSFVPEAQVKRMKPKNILWKNSYGSWESDILNEDRIEEEKMVIPPVDIDIHFWQLPSFLKEEMVNGEGQFFRISLFVEEKSFDLEGIKYPKTRMEWRWSKDYTKPKNVHVAHI